jgi:hypothetical protein
MEGDRMESTVKAACVTKEMVKMMGGDLTGGKVGGGKGGKEEKRLQTVKRMGFQWRENLCSCVRWENF